MAKKQISTVTIPIQGIFAGISSAFLLEKLIEKYKKMRRVLWTEILD